MPQPIQHAILTEADVADGFLLGLRRPKQLCARWEEVEGNDGARVLVLPRPVDPVLAVVSFTRGAELFQRGAAHLEGFYDAKDYLTHDGAHGPANFVWARYEVTYGYYECDLLLFLSQDVDGMQLMEHLKLTERLSATMPAKRLAWEPLAFQKGARENCALEKALTRLIQNTPN